MLIGNDVKPKILKEVNDNFILECPQCKIPFKTSKNSGFVFCGFCAAKIAPVDKTILWHERKAWLIRKKSFEKKSVKE